MIPNALTIFYASGSLLILLVLRVEHLENAVENQVNRLTVSDNKTQGCVKCCNSQANDIPIERVDLITSVAQMRKMGISIL